MSDAVMAEQPSPQLQGAKWTVCPAYFALYLTWAIGLSPLQDIQMGLARGDAAVAVGYVSTIDSVANIMQAFIVPHLGAMADSYGRKSVLLAGPLIGGIGNALLAASPSWTTVTIAKLSLNLSWSLTRLGAETTFSDLSQGLHLSQALNQFNMMIGVGMIIGSPMGSRMHTYFGARTTKMICALFCFVGAAVVAGLHTETLEQKNGSSSSSNVKQEAEEGGEKKSSVVKSKGGVSPVAFLKLFKDRQLGLLTSVNACQVICDQALEVDQGACSVLGSVCVMCV
jgi:MFS family permease